MKIAITGTNGFLAAHLAVFLTRNGFEVVGCGRGANRVQFPLTFAYSTVELTDVSSIDQFFLTEKPDILIHTAAMSKPDECLYNPEACMAVNVKATEYLCAACNTYGTRIIFSSTDFIFGEDGPHTETDTPAPLNFYGETKLMAEQHVLATVTNAVVFRPVFMYGNFWPGMRTSFIQWVATMLQANKPIKVVEDQWRTPTYVEDICNGVRLLIQQQQSGIYHLAGKDIVTPYDMAITVAEVLGLNKSLIEPVTSETFPEPVRRAKRSGLKIDKAMKELGYAPHSFVEGVRKSFL